MKLQIEIEGKYYFIGFVRDTAYKLSDKLGKDEELNSIEKCELMLKEGLKLYHPELEEEEKAIIIDYILENYGLLDEDIDGVHYDGLFTQISKLIEAAIPKGFTGQAHKRAILV